MKQSGLGRELGQEGLEAFQDTKHVHIETKIAPKEWWYPYGPAHSGPPSGAGRLSRLLDPRPAAAPTPGSLPAPARAGVGGAAAASARRPLVHDEAV